MSTLMCMLLATGCPPNPCVGGLAIAQPAPVWQQTVYSGCVGGPMGQGFGQVYADPAAFGHNGFGVGQGGYFGDGVVIDPGFGAFDTGTTGFPLPDGGIPADTLSAPLAGGPGEDIGEGVGFANTLDDGLAAIDQPATLSEEIDLNEELPTGFDEDFGEGVGFAPGSGGLAMGFPGYGGGLGGNSGFGTTGGGFAGFSGGSGGFSPGGGGDNGTVGGGTDNGGGTDTGENAGGPGTGSDGQNSNGDVIVNVNNSTSNTDTNGGGSNGGGGNNGNNGGNGGEQVPLPATAWMGLLGVGGLWLARRKCLIGG